MSGGGKSDLGRLLEMINGYQQTSVIVAALQVGLFDALGKGSATEADLAKSLGAHQPSLERLVRALHVFGVVERSGPEPASSISLTSTGRLLLKSGSFTLRDWAMLIGEEYAAAWGNLRHSVMTGENAFESVFKTTAWEHRKQHPELNEHFNRVTTSVQLRTINALLGAYDFTGRRCIVDVGGGHGNLVAGILKRYPDARGIVFDQPHVVDGAKPALEAAGVTDRCELVGGSFLESVPTGGDVYVMKHVLHNWDDADCVTILRACHTAMRSSSSDKASSALLVLENVLPEGDLDASALQLVMLDLHMMAVLGGRERTEREYAALFTAAGLTLTRCIPMREGTPNILEATARPN